MDLRDIEGSHLTEHLDVEYAECNIYRKKRSQDGQDHEIETAFGTIAAQEGGAVAGERRRGQLSDLAKTEKGNDCIINKD